MLFPLGLGHRFVKMPFMSIVLSILCILVYFMTSDDRYEFRNHITTAYLSSKYAVAQSQLYKEFCREAGEDSNVCEAGEIFIKNRLLQEPLAGIALYEVLRMMPSYLHFLSILRADISKFKNLKNYSKFFEARSKFVTLSAEVYEHSQRLSKTNLNLRAMFFSQFTHGNFFHLLASVIMIIAFGSYVEFKLGAVVLLLIYASAGLAGIAVDIFGQLPFDRFLLGASPNVSALMGAFYYAFFRHRLRFVYWFGPFVREYLIPVSLWFPFVYLSFEIIGGFQAFLWDGVGIAYLSHFTGFGIGLALGVFFISLSKVPTFFMYDFEWTKWSRVKQGHSEINSMIVHAEDILKYNPQNLKVIYDVSKRVAKGFSGNILDQKRGFSFFVAHLDYFLFEIARSGRAKMGMDILGRIPQQTLFNTVFSHLSDATLITYGKFAMKKAKPRLALAILSFLVNRNKKLVNIEAVLNKIDDLVSIELDSVAGHDMVLFLHSKVSDQNLKNLFQKHIQFNKTKIVQGL